MNTNRTFLEIQDAIKTEMQLDPGLISELERKSFINDALKDVGGIGLFEKYSTLVIDNGIATLPDDLVDIIDIKFGDRYLVPMENQNGLSMGETPMGYIARYNSIELVPKPTTGVVDVYYSYRPKPLVDPTDTPEIPNGFDLMLIDYSVSRAHRKNGNIGLAREYMATYAERKGELYQELTRRLNTRVVNIVNREHLQMAPTPFDFL